MNIYLTGRIRHAGDLIVMKVGLLDCAIARSNLTTPRDARSKYGCALQLRSNIRRVEAVPASTAVSTRGIRSGPDRILNQRIELPKAVRHAGP
jgi:hypothetical protein